MPKIHCLYRTNICISMRKKQNKDVGESSRPYTLIYQLFCSIFQLLWQMFNFLFSSNNHLIKKDWSESKQQLLRSTQRPTNPFSSALFTSQHKEWRVSRRLYGFVLYFLFCTLCSLKQKRLSANQIATVLLGNVVILVIIVMSFVTKDLKRLVQPLYVFWPL